MNKRRRFKAKAIRRWFGGVRAKRFGFVYPTCVICGEYLMACTCNVEFLRAVYDRELEMRALCGIQMPTLSCRILE